jgi:hypothetical protein
MKIGILVIATNKYVKFTFPLYESAKKHFMQGHEVTMFVFTNMPDVPVGTVRVEQEHLPWPMPTLMRYHVFLKNRELLKDMDYLFYSDADMLFVDAVGDEALGSLVATTHPGFFNKHKSQYSYERRPESAAFMGPNDGYAYFAGGFNGGKRDTFLGMAEEIKKMIDSDAQKGIVAVWHDESYMNKYLSMNMPTNVLNPSYCYPESASLPFKKRLLALDKNHQEMRS